MGGDGLANYNSSHTGTGIDNAIERVIQGAGNWDKAIQPDSDDKVPADAASAAIVTLTANTTLALAHAGRMILMNSTSARTITIPTNASVAFPVGTEIEVCRYGTGTVTIAAASGVTILSAGGSVVLGDRYSCIGMKQIAANTWLLTGGLG